MAGVEPNDVDMGDFLQMLENCTIITNHITAGMIDNFQEGGQYTLPEATLEIIQTSLDALRRLRVTDEVVQEARFFHQEILPETVIQEIINDVLEDNFDVNEEDNENDEEEDNENDEEEDNENEEEEDSENDEEDEN